MNACILYFSPSGHTRKVAEALAEEMQKNEVKAQLIDVTGLRDLQEASKLRGYLEKTLMEHELLFLGAPVYAGHFESNMLRVIRELPAVNGKWGSAVVPFVTYGGLHSSIALMEAGMALKETGRKSIAGLKISSFHTLTKEFHGGINQGKPGKEEYAVIGTFIETLLSEGERILQAEDISNQFDYVSEEEKQLYLAKSQDDWHQAFRNVTIDAERCKNCSICVKSCPVTRMKMNTNGIVQEDKSIKCILCAECFHKCPHDAIRFSYINAVKERMKMGEAPRLEEVQNECFYATLKNY